MSIILKALKKIQDEKAEHPGDIGASGKERDKERTSDPAVSPAAAPMTTGKSAASGTESMKAEPAQSRSHRPASARSATPRQATRHGFGFGPKMLLLLVAILGVFTTGWFTNKIYFSMKLAANPNKSDSGAKAQQPTEYLQAIQVVPPLSEPAVPASVDTPVSAKVSAASSAEGEVTLPALSPPQIVRTSPVSLPSESLSQALSQASPEASSPKPMRPEREQTSATVKEPKPEKKGRPEFKINAIAWKSDEPKAIVNMQRVYEGDVIDGATVLAIEKKAILFEYDGEVFEVRF